MTFYLLNELNESNLKPFYEKALSELNDFFEINWKYNLPKVFIYDSTKTGDSLREGKREPWQIGWIKGQEVFIMAKEKIGIESPHKRIKNDLEYSALIKHELVHCFYRILSKGAVKPDWLWEGIAIYLSNELKNKKDPAKLAEFLDFYEKSGQKVYKESGFAVQFLIEKFGKEKMLKLIKSTSDIKNSQEFSEKFKEIYNFDLDYKNFS